MTVLSLLLLLPQGFFVGLKPYEKSPLNTWGFSPGTLSKQRLHKPSSRTYHASNFGTKIPRKAGQYAQIKKISNRAQTSPGPIPAGCSVR